MKKIRYTVIGVLVFLIALLFALSDEAKAEPTIGLGYTVANSTLPTGEVGYRWHDKWSINAAVIGEGSTKKGDQDHVNIISASRLVRPGWRIGSAECFMRIGLALARDSPLVGRGNYRLGAGVDFGVWEVEYTHYSSAGINVINTGIDALSVRVKL